MGQKSGKNTRDAEEEEPCPEHSPKRTSKRLFKFSDRQSTPYRDHPISEHEPSQSRQNTPHDVEAADEKENSKKEDSGSPSRSPQKKAKEASKIISSPNKAKSSRKPRPQEMVEEPVTLECQSTVDNPGLPSAHQAQKMESKELEALTPLIVEDNDLSLVAIDPQTSSTPAAIGVTGSGVPSSCPQSPGSATDQSEDEGSPPLEQQELPKRQSMPDFGRFYITSYLEGPKSNYLWRSSNALDKERSKSFHYHRPPDFSYVKDMPDFLRKKGSGMSALTTGKRRLVKVRRSSSPAGVHSEEAIRLSMYPSAKPKAPNEPDKIERDDWPGPASPAVILSEILRERRKSGGGQDTDVEEEEEKVQEDPKIQQKMEEILKIKDQSGIGKVVFQELVELKQKPVKSMDPWKASRVPSAKYEPRYHTRYQSPMFASPSRFVDVTRRSWDDHDIRVYRSVSTLANLPTPRPGYGLAHATPRAATLPASGLYGGRDLTFFGFRDIGQDSEEHRKSNYTSSSTLTGDILFKNHGSRISSMAVYDVPSIPLLQLQKSTWHTEYDPPVYDYEKLKITHFDLPRDVDRNKLEIHLNDEQFEKLFRMPRDKFYRLAEWKRNDMKKKLDLY